MNTEARSRSGETTLSVVIPTYDDSLLTVGAVEAVMEHGAGSKRLEVVVWDNGSSAGVSAVLDSLPHMVESTGAQVLKVVLIVLGVGTLFYALVAVTEFFVAGRSLGPGLIFATFLAANIVASSTGGAAGHAYRDGLAAWWWNGSAGVGTLILAFWVGPKIWQKAQAHNLLTVGDFLEHHFGYVVRAAAALISPRAWRNAGGRGRPEIGKFSTARVVWIP